MNRMKQGIMCITAIACIGGYYVYKTNDQTATPMVVEPAIAVDTDATVQPTIEPIASQAQLDEFIAAAPNSVMIKAYAPWCPHCQAMQPLFKKLAKQYAGKITFAEINVDTFDNQAGLGVASLPTFIMYKKGQRPKNAAGSRTENQLRMMAEELL